MLNDGSVNAKEGDLLNGQTETEQFLHNVLLRLRSSLDPFVIEVFGSAVNGFCVAGNVDLDCTVVIKNPDPSKFDERAHQLMVLHQVKSLLEEAGQQGSDKKRTSTASAEQNKSDLVDASKESSVTVREGDNSAEKVVDNTSVEEGSEDKADDGIQNC